MTISYAETVYAKVLVPCVDLKHEPLIILLIYGSICNGFVCNSDICWQINH